MKRVVISIEDGIYEKLKGVNVSEICKRVLRDYAKYMDKDMVKLMNLKRVEELYLRWLAKADKSGERVKTSVSIPIGILEVLKKRNINVSRLVSELLYIYLQDEFDEAVEKKYKEVKRKREEFEKDIRIDMLFNELRGLVKNSESEDEFMEKCVSIVEELKRLDVELDEEYLRKFYRMMK